MPRLIGYNPDRYKAADRNARARGYHVAAQKNWVDPFPLGFGTLPEKMVYNALSRRGIRFYYLNDYTYTIPEIDFAKEFQTDFILPDLKITIEVQGAHWHSMPTTIDADAFKFAVYQAAGWRPLAWWDFDILANVNLLFIADPVLSAYNVVNDVSTELTPLSRKKADTSKGIRTLNYKRGQRLSYKKAAPRVVNRRVKGKTLGRSVF